MVHWKYKHYILTFTIDGIAQLNNPWYAVEKP